MSNKALDNLVKIGQLKKEPFAQSEYDTYIRSGKGRVGFRVRIQLVDETPAQRFHQSVASIG